MENQPLISVVMNCYNGQEFLREAIESVIEQTYSNWELIFWDNQSSDDSRKIAESFLDDRIKYYYAPSHTNLAVARNLAIEKTSGEWIGFLDTDDLWFPKKLELQVQKMNHSNLGLIYSFAEAFEGDLTRYILPARFKNVLPEGDLLEELLKGNFITLPTALFLKKAYEKVGPIPSDLVFASDYFLFLNISRYYRINAIQEVTARYRMHNNNWTKKQKVESVFEPIYIVKNLYSDLNESERKRTHKFNYNRRISERIIVLLIYGHIKQFFRGVFQISNPFFVFYYGLRYIYREIKNN
ncbi:MAG: glycosyltransferase [Leptospiraceae bacterium]|nr:glycosyltransferase [Leptospiraceae bacterium]